MMIIIALGSNLPGVWGTSPQALRRALSELEKSGVHIIRTSRLYHTAAYGVTSQPAYVNAVAIVTSHLPAQTMLRVFKQIEARSGRRPARRWGPRPLDLDIVDYRGVIFNWNMKRPSLRRCVILPHADAHKRAFVLRPLADVAPSWHHPVFGLTAVELLKKPHVRDAGAILEDAGFLI